MGLSWIGLNDIVEEGKFVWSDGSLVNFIPFASNEPSSEVDNEDCVVLEKHGGMYFDAPCEWPQNFICETNYESLYA